MSPAPSNLDIAKGYLPSPAPDELSESDSDITPTLEKKRREIDEEIEAFHWQKEKEFRAFEDELRSRKRRGADSGPHRLRSLKSGLSELMENKLNMNGNVTKEKEKKSDDRYLDGFKSALRPRKPSVSVDKVTINGMTTPPVSGTPPLGRTLPQSPTNLSATPPRSSAKESANPPSLPDRGNSFHRVFTPGYLRLLDTQPSSLPQNSTSPSVSRSKRAVTSPKLPSNSLPSALRTTSQADRKRKHVTFQLTDSVVVDPSSSYEESPSPSEDQDEEKLDETGLGLPPNPVPIEMPRSVSDVALTSPKDDLNEGGFFSFDEELADDDYASKYEDAQEDDAAELDAVAEMDDKEQAPKPSEIASPTFSSGSLPIDIVKPSLSFNASLGA